jgi:hypothetical protein
MSTEVSPGFAGYELLLPACFNPGTRPSDAPRSGTPRFCGPSGHS